MVEKAGLVYNIKQNIDAKDKKLLRVLFEDGRMSIADLSRKTGLRRDSIARRLKRLRKDRIITAFVPIINPPPGAPYSTVLFMLLLMLLLISGFKPAVKYSHGIPPHRHNLFPYIFFNLTISILADSCIE